MTYRAVNVTFLIHREHPLRFRRNCCFSFLRVFSDHDMIKGVQTFCTPFFKCTQHCTLECKIDVTCVCVYLEVASIAHPPTRLFTHHCTPFTLYMNLLYTLYLMKDLILDPQDESNSPFLWHMTTIK